MSSALPLAISVEAPADLGPDPAGDGCAVRFSRPNQTSSADHGRRPGPVRDLTVPEYIERWGRGAEGEKRTAKELEKLGADWQVRHDLNGRYGNVDHMVIGPAGVLLLDTKAWLYGTTTITADGPEVAARHDDGCVWHWRGLPARMRGAAAGASDGMHALSSRRVFVRPVVVIWGDFPGKVQERGGVTYVAGEHLVEWLEALPPRLSPQDRQALAPVS